MPFYDLTCRQCGHTMNVMAKIADLEARRIKCPQCQSTDLQRVYGNINVLKSRSSDSVSSCSLTGQCGSCCPRE